MMTNIDRDTAHALAALVHHLRSDWDTAGILKALSDSRDRANAWQLAHAALYAAEIRTNRTPAVIALSGAHWTRGNAAGEAGDIRAPRCKVEGHTSYLAANCGACRSERLASETPPEVHIVTLSPEQSETNARGARIVRAALAANIEGDK